MPQHKSCKKRLKTSNKSRLYNRAYTSQMRKQLKSYRDLDPQGAAEALPGVYAMLDTMARKGIIKRQKADRLKSRLSKLAQGGTA